MFVWLCRWNPTGCWSFQIQSFEQCNHCSNEAIEYEKNKMCSDCRNVVCFRITPSWWCDTQSVLSSSVCPFCPFLFLMRPFNVWFHVARSSWIDVTYKESRVWLVCSSMKMHKYLLYRGAYRYAYYTLSFLHETWLLVAVPTQHMSLLLKRGGSFIFLMCTILQWSGGQNARVVV